MTGAPIDGVFPSPEGRWNIAAPAFAADVDNRLPSPVSPDHQVRIDGQNNSLPGSHRNSQGDRAERRDCGVEIRSRGAKSDGREPSPLTPFTTTSSYLD